MSSREHAKCTGRRVGAVPCCALCGRDPSIKTLVFMEDSGTKPCAYPGHLVSQRLILAVSMKIDQQGEEGAGGKLEMTSLLQNLKGKNCKRGKKDTLNRAAKSPQRAPGLPRSPCQEHKKDGQGAGEQFFQTKETQAPGWPPHPEKHENKEAV